MEGIDNVDGVRDFVFVFHFRFGQGRTAVQAKLHRLGAAIQITGLVDFAQRAHGVGFGLVVHGQVGLVPVAQHAQTDKVFFLAGNLLGGVFAAQLAKTARRHIFAMQFFHHHFNRQAVAVPARHIGRVKTRQRFAADDDVFQNLIDCMTDVDVAVGIGRAVVQDEFRPSRRLPAQFGVALLLLPLLHPTRLALGQIAAHGEGGFVKIDGFGIVGHGVSSI